QRWVPEISIRLRPALPGGAADPRGPDTTVLGGSSARLFGCKVGDGATFPRADVKMTVWDADLNSDYCSVELYLVDNMGDCAGQSLASIGGTITTMHYDPVKEVEVELNANLPEYPVKSKTDNMGAYQFDNLPIGARYEVKPRKTHDYLNGVNTLDLVQIQRHILGIKRLEDPYLMIAADADGDEAIRIGDVIELRKLILGISDRLPKLDSWRMVKKNHEMGTRPWPFEEIILHGILRENQNSSDFIAVKVGDVDGSANANMNTMSIQPRNVGVRLSLEDNIVQSGHEIEVTLTAEAFDQVYGMQFTLEHKGLELLSIEGRGIDLTQDHVGKYSNDVTTVSWVSVQGSTIQNGEVVIRMRFKSNITTKLSNALHISSEITSSEAYIGTSMERVGIALETRGLADTKATVKLSQNEPNPWKDHTVIKYELPQSGKVLLTIVDMIGREVFRKEILGVKGDNEYHLKPSDINNQSGIFNYIIEVGDQIIQKKMIALE
ncbi:MAG TPA: hypothetical protein PKD85_17075, partial [Saprospiraceae bacterium]|nr:hypothetical protein [Saprospiraceae bacterium]